VIEFLTSLGKDTLAYAVVLLVLGVMGQLTLAARKHRGDKEVAQLTADEALKRHNNEISIQLLEQLRKELARALAENARLSPYFDRAKNLAHHLDCILSATPEQRDEAEERARDYLRSLRD
jgi:hypothetical protein